MFANTVTASSRKASPTTGLGAAAVIGYPSSRLPSSSALIAETSASTASISVPVCTQRPHHIQQRRGHVPQPPPTSRLRREVDIGAMRFALGAAAAGLAAPPGLFHQRPGQQQLRVAQPGH